MSESGFRKLFWGFLFILLDFRINGFDILPNIVGYIFFAVGLSILAEKSFYFIRARNFNIPMIILSFFSIYQKPAQGNGIQLGTLGLLSIPLAIASMVLSILVVYNIFKGIKEMAENQGQMEIYSEAGTRWNQFLLLQVAVVLVFVLIFIPVLAIVYIIALYILSIVVTTQIMLFMKRCGEHLNT